MIRLDIIMNDVELKLRSLVSNESSYNLLMFLAKLACASENRNSITYNQANLFNAPEFEQHATLKPFVLKYGGLCELVTNSVISDNLMGSKDNVIRAHFEKLDLSLLDIETMNDHTIRLIFKVLMNNAVNPYKKNLSCMHLDSYSTTHLLDITSYFQQMMAYCLGVYPFSLFSAGEHVKIQAELDATAHSAALERQLHALEDGSYIKFMVFRRGWFEFTGHALAIKKTGDSFSFFDPNVGETFDLNFSQLCHCIMAAKKTYNGTSLAFLDGNTFVKTIADRIGQEEKKADIGETASEDPITRFILSEIQKMVDLGQYTDKDLIVAMNRLQSGVETRMQEQTATGMSFIPPKPELKPEPLSRYNIATMDDKITALDRIRRFASERSLETLLSALGSTSYLSVKQGQDLSHDTLTTLAQFVKSPYDLNAVASSLNARQLESLCLVLNDKLPSLISNTRHMAIAFCCLYFENNKILFNALKARLPAMLDSPHDINVTFKGLYQEQRAEVFELIRPTLRARLPELITSFGDIADILESLSTDQRRLIINDIRPILTTMVRDAHDTAHDYLSALQCLEPADASIVIDVMMTTLNTLVVEDVSTVCKLCDYLSTEQTSLFLASIKDKLPDLIHDISSINNLLKVIPVDQHEAYLAAPLQNILTIKFNNIMSSEDAIALSTALIGNDYAQIKEKFDLATISIGCDDQSFLIKMGYLGSYWLEKLNVALSLELDKDYKYHYIQSPFEDIPLFKQALQNYMFARKSAPVIVSGISNETTEPRPLGGEQPLANARGSDTSGESSEAKQAAIATCQHFKESIAKPAEPADPSEPTIGN